MSVSFFGIQFNTAMREEVLSRVRALLLSEKKGQMIFTPNAEMLVLARRDSHFRAVLNRASINICDGSGPAFFARLFERKKLPRIPGVDFAHDVCALAATLGKRVYLLGSEDIAVLKQVTAVMKERYPTLNIVGMHPGIAFHLQKTEQGTHQLHFDKEAFVDQQDDIIMAAPDILMVGFGHPKQELYLDAYLSDLPTVQLALGIGGAFDFYAGKATRAPQWLQTIGLESLSRLIREPWRWKRVGTALLVFPFLYLTSFFRK